MPAVLLTLLLVVASLGLAQAELAQAESALVPSATKICVVNSAVFQLSFFVWDTVTNQVSGSSDPYVPGGRACMPLGALGEPGHPMVAVVQARGGISKSISPVIRGAANGSEATTASFTCSGSTGAFSCGLGGEIRGQNLPMSTTFRLPFHHLQERRHDQPGARVFPGEPASEPVRVKGICMHNAGAFLLRFRLWDTATGFLSVWSGGIIASPPASGRSPVCMDGSRVNGVAGGHPLVPIVSPQGTTPGSFRSVIYDPNATTHALFLCTGSNLEFDCRLLG